MTEILVVYAVAFIIVAVIEIYNLKQETKLANLLTQQQQMIDDMDKQIGKLKRDSVEKDIHYADKHMLLDRICLLEEKVYGEITLDTDSQGGKH